MVACARCGTPIHVLIAVPSQWFPGDGGQLVCVRCADDDEINAWVMSPEFGGERRVSRR